MRLERIELSYQAWKASVMAIILQPRINIYMKKLTEGNVYNVQQEVSAKDFSNVSKSGLKEWSAAVRKELMQKLRSYSPEQVDKIIKSTFGDTISSL